MARRVLHWVGVAALVIGYPMLAHHTNEAANDGRLGALVALAPAVVLGLVLAWHSNHRAVMLAMLGLACAALWMSRSVLTQHFGMVYWLQYIGAQLVLFITFARTLVAGRRPLCTQFAEVVHAPLTRRLETYTRQVTIAWCLFFAAMALISTLLFFLAPLTVWSVFDNFLTLPLVASMFIGEYCVRRRVLPDLRHSRILDAVRVYRDSTARQHW